MHTLMVLFLGLHHPPVFDQLQYANTEWEGLGDPAGSYMAIG